MQTSVHPHKGYLNTKFHLSVKGEVGMNYIVKRQEIEQCRDKEPIISGSINPYEPCSITINKPGNWIISFENGDSYPLVVEDGYKFGGGKYKKSFIFDDCPWCFVVMHDRTYFYNRETEESYVETISPDGISFVSADFVLLKNNYSREISLYDLNLQKPILTFADEVFHNTEVLVWRESDVDGNKKELVIYSLVSRHQLHRIQYEIFCLKDEILYWGITDNICSVTLNHESGIHDIIKVEGKLINFVDSLVAISYYCVSGEKKLCVYKLIDGEIIGEIPVNGTLASVNEHVIVNVHKSREAICAFNFDNAGFPEATITAEYEEYKFYPAEWDVFYTKKTTSFEKKGSSQLHENRVVVLKSLYSTKRIKLKKEGDCYVSDHRIIFYNSSESYVRGRHYLGSGHRAKGIIHKHNDIFILEEDEHIFTLNKNGYWDNPEDGKYDFKYFENYGVIKNAEDEKYHIPGSNIKGNTIHIETNPIEHLLIGHSAIIKNGEVIYPADKLKSFSTRPTAVSKSGLWGLLIKNGDITLLRIKGNKEFSYNILANIYDNSEYRSVLLSETGEQIMYRDGDKIEVLDIRSGNSECYENLSYVKHVNGIRPLFRQAGSLLPRVINPVTGQHLDCNSLSEYKYISPDNRLYADTELHKYIEYYHLIKGRIISTDEFRKLYNSFSFGSNTRDEKNPNYQRLLDKRKAFVKDNLEFYKTYAWFNKRNLESAINHIIKLDNALFVDLFIKKRGIAIIRNIKTNAEVARIKLGEPLSYINYVSFSPDSRYVSLAGYRNGLGGLFLIYDLTKGETLLHRDTNRAVWNTAFSKNGAVTAYTSNPLTFFIPSIDQLDKDLMDKMNERNFLTFSPDGTVFALSNQGYISKYDMYGDICESWGHQTSTFVEVRQSANYKNKLVSFNDLSDCGIAESNQRENVASVSFSNDNSRLMMVGSDGVVIIRNLHLEDYASE